MNDTQHAHFNTFISENIFCLLFKFSWKLKELYIINCHIRFSYWIVGLLICIKSMAFELVFITEQFTGVYEVNNNNKYWSQVKVI